MEPLEHPVGSNDVERWSRPQRRLDGNLIQDVLLPRSDIHFAFFEMPMSQALQLLTPSLHPSNPATMAMIFAKCPESLWGAFEFALVGVGCRSGIRPRFLILNAFASTPEAVQSLGQFCVYPAQLAEVHTDIYYDEVKSSVKENGRVLLDVRTANLKNLTGTGASIVYSPTLSMSEVDARRCLVQVDWSADFKRVDRGVSVVSTFDGRALLRSDACPTDPIAGTIAKVDLTLHKPVFTLDPIILPNDGGVKKLLVVG